MRRFVLPASWDGLASQDTKPVPDDSAPQRGEAFAQQGLSGAFCELGLKDTKRLTAVLRMGVGDSFPGIDSRGLLYTCVLQEVHRKGSRLLVFPAVADDAGSGQVLADIRGNSKKTLDARNGHPCGSRTTGHGEEHGALPQSDPIIAPIPRLILALGLLKGSKLDDVVRAATEAGVSAIVPLATSRSVPRGDSSARIDRYRRIVQEAIGQSGSTTATVITPVQTIPDFASAYPATPQRTCLVFHETPLAPCALHRYCTDTRAEIVACIGPEGGFSGEELGILNEKGYAPAWLGPAVLRAETAAIFAIASLRIICMERFSWSTAK